MVLPGVSHDFHLVLVPIPNYINVRVAIWRHPPISFAQTQTKQGIHVAFMRRTHCTGCTSADQRTS